MHDDRRLDAGRHQRADRIGRGNNLRDRKFEIDVRLEVNFDHRQAVQGLGFDVLDPLTFEEIEYWLYVVTRCSISGVPRFGLSWYE